MAHCRLTAHHQNLLWVSRRCRHLDVSGPCQRNAAARSCHLKTDRVVPGFAVRVLRILAPARATVAKDPLPARDGPGRVIGELHIKRYIAARWHAIKIRYRFRWCRGDLNVGGARQRVAATRPRHF